MKTRARRWGCRFLLSLLCVLMIAACGNPIRLRTRFDEVKIGLLAPMTGDFSSRGDPMRRAAQMAVEEVNIAGGLQVGDRRYRITLLIEDTQSTPEEAIAAARRLLDDDVVAIIGTSASSIAIPVAEVLNQERMLMIAPLSSNPETTLNKRYVFRITATDDVQGKVMAEFAFYDLNAQRVAVLFQEDDVYSSFLAEVFEETYADISGNTVIAETFTAEDEDVSEQLRNIQKSAADALFLPILPQTVPRFVHQIREMGITIPLLGSDTWATIYPEDLDESYNNSYFSAAWSPTLESERSQAFEQAFTERYGLIPVTVEALTYDAFGLFFAAVQDQGSFEPKAVIKGISILESYEGVSGKATYLGHGDPIRDMIVIKIQDGEHHIYKLVEP